MSIYAERNAAGVKEETNEDDRSSQQQIRKEVQFFEGLLKTTSNSEHRDQDSEECGGASNRTSEVRRWLKKQLELDELTCKDLDESSF